jgi:4-amino-4-deoxy-L-arabinose transferase-like glycosyltransferase
MQTTHILALVLVLALVLRLLNAFTLDPLLPYTDRGGDTAWYLQYGAMFLRGIETGPLTPPPLYLIFVGLPQLFIAPELATIFIRVLQAVAGTVICYFVFRLARELAGTRAGLIAAALIALNPIFILECGNITSETLFLFFLTAALTAYVEAVSRADISIKRFAWVGLLFALATFTRAALLAFPLGILIHAALIYRPRDAFRVGMTILLVFLVVLSTWTIYYKLRWDRWIIAGEGLAGFIYLGTVGWEGPFETDARLEEIVSPDAADAPREAQYVDAAANIITSDLGGYISRRVSEWAGAYLTPHGVYWFPGESLRELALRWLREDFSANGFLRLVQGDAFVPKAAFYIIHYIGLVAGILGIYVSRRQWRKTLPLIGYIAYVSLMHLVLYALPRYIFPATLFYWVFASLWLSQMSVFRAHPKDA